MKKLLILGGSFFQLPAIKYAKSHGYYVITCDYLPNNPGHSFSDEYHNISTTEKEKVLELSLQLQIDGILCYASDPAAATAAYVSTKMGLPGNSYENILQFVEKHRWRDFLLKNNFDTPKAKAYSAFNEIIISEWSFPMMVKPIDSCGSKGVRRVDNVHELKVAFDYAMQYSKTKTIIIEEYIKKTGPQIGGDGYFGTDQLEFVCFGDQVVDESVNQYVPCGMKFPSALPENKKLEIKKEIEKAILLSGLQNFPFNLEVMLDEKGGIFLMEIGPRNGGNCIPEVIEYYTGVDMVRLAVEAAMGIPFNIENQKQTDKCYAYYALHSTISGKYKGYSLTPDFKGNVLETLIFIEEDTWVDKFNGSNQTIGILLIEFENRDDMNYFFNNSNSLVNLQVI